MIQAEVLFQKPWAELQAMAWHVRRTRHPDTLMCAVPGARRYVTERYTNTPHHFAAISLTGRSCELMCDHCRGRLLQTMYPAHTPDALLALGQRLLTRGCTGVLISGGADSNGAVPLKPHLEAIGQLKEWGLRVIVHTGLPDAETIAGLKAASVDQVLFDVIGDRDTIHQVLHLNHIPEDYAAALRQIREVGIPVAPHVVIGLHYGTLRGELNALEIIRQAGVDVVVLVVLRPLPHTPMRAAPLIPPEVVGRLAAVARLLCPDAYLTLGCARPVGPSKLEMERLALLAGVNGIAYPDPSSVKTAEELKLKARFIESCCTLGTPVHAGGQPALAPQAQFQPSAWVVTSSNG